MKDDKLEITELFMCKAGNDWSRCFHGTIKRLVDADGNSFVFSKIKIGNGYIVAQAANQDKLGARLDELVLMVLDYRLHDNAGVTTGVASQTFFLN